LENCFFQAESGCFTLTWSERKLCFIEHTKKRGQIQCNCMLDRCENFRTPVAVTRNYEKNCSNNFFVHSIMLQDFTSYSSFVSSRKHQNRQRYERRREKLLLLLVFRSPYFAVFQLAALE